MSGETERGAIIELPKFIVPVPDSGARLHWRVILLG